MLCRHCQKTKSNRPRGLCWTCYYTAGVRELYPSTSKFARRGPGNFNGQAPLPDLPTDAAPGSEAKILILMERAILKQALFHPADSMLILPPLDMLAEAMGPAPEPLRVAG
jgi:hypothetical protein